MRQYTSAIAHSEAVASGRIGRKQLEVLLAFECYGPGTSAEVLNASGLDGDNLNLMRARVTELANAGKLVGEESRPCKLTGRKALVWRVLRDGEVASPRKPESTKEIARAAWVEAWALYDSADVTKTPAPAFETWWKERGK